MPLFLHQPSQKRDAECHEMDGASHPTASWPSLFWRVVAILRAAAVLVQPMKLSPLASQSRCPRDIEIDSCGIGLASKSGVSRIIAVTSPYSVLLLPAIPREFQFLISMTICLTVLLHFHLRSHPSIPFRSDPPRENIHPPRSPLTEPPIVSICPSVSPRSPRNTLERSNLHSIPRRLPSRIPHIP